MAMYNPPHPGEFITDVYLDPNVSQPTTSSIVMLSSD